MSYVLWQPKVPRPPELRNRLGHVCIGYLCQALICLQMCAHSPVFPRMRLLASCLLLIFESSLTRGSVPLPDGDGTNTCPEGWVDSSLVNMGCIFLGTSPHTWDEASKLCQGLNGTLVEIEDEMQMEFLQMQLQLLEGPDATRPFWAGGRTDNDQEPDLKGDWKWATSSSPVGDFVWGERWPIDAQRASCLMLAPSMDYKGSNYYCGDNIHLPSNYHHHPLCQMK